MKSYLLSALARSAALGKDRFLESFNNEWLVWEAGMWKAPRAATVMFSADMMKEPEPAPKEAESLAIVLEPRPEGLTLGRASTCDIVINDGTLSSTHLLFKKVGLNWTVEDLNSKNGSTLESSKLVPGLAMPVRERNKIRAAQVNLTFYSSGSLWTRLVPR